jgi:hypothetical protein
MGERHRQEFAQLMAKQYEARMQKLRDAMEGFLKDKASARQAVLSDAELAKDSTALLQTLQDLESNFAAKYVLDIMRKRRTRPRVLMGSAFC